jgi:hypothetical protein
VAEKNIISAVVAVIIFISCVSHVLIKSVFTVWNCGSFTEKFSEKVRNHRKRLDLYPAINIHPLIDLHPVISENTLASHPSDGFLHFSICGLFYWAGLIL